MPRDIVRTLRRLCLLHEMESDAAAISAEERRLEHLLAVARAAGSPATLSAERVEAVRRQEQERAANAAAMSELLAPLLSERFETMAPTRPATGAALTGRTPAGRHSGRPPAPLPIADLIDGMLAQEEPPAPPRRP